MLLRVIVVEQLTPFPFTLLGWSVEDIAETVAALTARGVAFDRFEGVEQDDLGVWRSPGGAHVADDLQEALLARPGVPSVSSTSMPTIGRLSGIPPVLPPVSA